MNTWLPTVPRTPTSYSSVLLWLASGQRSPNKDWTTTSPSPVFTFETEDPPSSSTFAKFQNGEYFWLSSSDSQSYLNLGGTSVPSFAFMATIQFKLSDVTQSSPFIVLGRTCFDSATLIKTKFALSLTKTDSSTYVFCVSSGDINLQVLAGVVCGQGNASPSATTTVVVGATVTSGAAVIYLNGVAAGNGNVNTPTTQSNLPVLIGGSTSCGSNTNGCDDDGCSLVSNNQEVAIGEMVVIGTAATGFDMLSYSCFAADKFDLSNACPTGCGNADVDAGETCDSGTDCRTDCKCPAGYVSDNNRGCVSLAVISASVSALSASSAAVKSSSLAAVASSSSAAAASASAVAVSTSSVIAASVSAVSAASVSAVSASAAAVISASSASAAAVISASSASAAAVISASSASAAAVISASSASAASVVSASSAAAASASSASATSVASVMSASSASAVSASRASASSASSVSRVSASSASAVSVSSASAVSASRASVSSISASSVSAVSASSMSALRESATSVIAESTSMVAASSAGVVSVSRASVSAVSVSARLAANAANSSGSAIGPIIGAVLGVLLVAAIIAAILIRRRRTQRKQSPPSEPVVASSTNPLYLNHSNSSSDVYDHVGAHESLYADAAAPRPLKTDYYGSPQDAESASDDLYAAPDAKAGYAAPAGKSGSASTKPGPMYSSPEDSRPSTSDDLYAAPDAKDYAAPSSKSGYASAKPPTSMYSSPDDTRNPELYSDPAEQSYDAPTSSFGSSGEAVYAKVNKPPKPPLSAAQVEGLYAQVNKPRSTPAASNPAIEDLYAKVNKPPKPPKSSA
ncbi:hypothetical protein, variant [Capsaspora owczarzaki ATCC 30864]|uniref:Uncharacterized protein n=1 Tax=Capsaspora owczarzaki (strain ATCC 30864) TaxID=595528 RepID=A0A0D2WML7_CAPO3|nr:hypothetical protein, variant [Capsaspora owczarzaki ATCC 30864]